MCGGRQSFLTEIVQRIHKGVELIFFVMLAPAQLNDLRIVRRGRAQEPRNLLDMDNQDAIEDEVQEEHHDGGFCGLTDEDPHGFA
ncbi:hypothetical protein D3C87_1732440 [compost metagenome]